jgi:hypothetical protein
MNTHRLNLEFAPQARRVSAIGVVALLVATLVFAAAVYQLGTARREQNRAQEHLAILEETRPASTQRLQKPPRRDPVETARAVLVQQTSQRLSTPWADLLSALESAPPNVALLVVEPSAAKRSVALTAEAASPSDMLKYLRALQEDSRFADAVLVSHQIQLQAPGTPVRFQLRARWGEGR